MNCNQPFGSERRRFLKSCTVLAAAALASGLSPAAALEIRWTRATRRAQELTYPVPATDGVEIDREHSVLLARYEHHLYAFSMICPHQRAAVKWLPGQNIFQCTKHKSKYSPGGAYLSGRATRSLDRHPLRVAGQTVVVDAAVLLKEDEDAAAWNAAVAQV